MAIRVEGFNVNVFHGWADIGEAPGDSLVVSHDHVRNSGKRDPGDVKAAAAKMGLVPQVRHLVPEMHVIGEQRLARNCVLLQRQPSCWTQPPYGPRSLFPRQGPNPEMTAL